MAVKILKIDDIPKEEQTPLVLMLLESLNALREENQALRDEIARLKGQKPKPDIKPSKLERRGKKDKKSNKKRPGSTKRKKSQILEIHDTVKIPPDDIPPGSWFKEYNDFLVQGLRIKPFNTRYRLERWESPDGRTFAGQLPPELNSGHFDPELKRFILYQYYQAHVTQPLLLEQLLEIGIDISAGQLNNIITEGHDSFHAEKDGILEAGFRVSEYINVDDTGARHKGKNGYCTHIGNELFATFHSTYSKSRINFLELLRAGYTDYVINPDALSYMASQGLPQNQLLSLSTIAPFVFEDEKKFKELLESQGFQKERHIRIATEGALIGSLVAHGFNTGMVIVSDDAGQFNILNHALCWVHAERLINKLVGFSDEHKQAIDATRSKIWDLYDSLKDFKKYPDISKRAGIVARFDEIFTEKTCFATLNSALKRIYRNKSELLKVLEHPDIPLHNNLSENDIREYVKRRKISGSTKSSIGRQCRDTFTSLKKTCRKLRISFWDYLKDRLCRLNVVPYLPDCITAKAEEIFC
jgi:hypothetical protein